MKTFNKPKNLNGAQLLEELASVGISLSSENPFPFDDGLGNLFLDVLDDDFDKAKMVVENHFGKTNPAEVSVEDKLKNAGLSVEELKIALGL